MLNGQRIREIRLEKGLTCSDVSNLSRSCSIQISKSYLEELERGSKLNPSFNVVETIANILSVNLDDLRTN
jgi:transcriptional regulator with XRE-family HTH domain